jgi:hypothetical protein
MRGRSPSQQRRTREFVGLELLSLSALSMFTRCFRERADCVRYGRTPPGKASTSWCGFLLECHSANVVRQNVFPGTAEAMPGTPQPALWPQVVEGGYLILAFEAAGCQERRPVGINRSVLARFGYRWGLS